MRRVLTVVTAAAFLTLGAFAHGQAIQDEQRAPASSTKVNLSLEQEHIIKEIVKDLRVEPAAGSVPETVGAAVPDAAPLRPIPPEIGDKVPQIRSHRFLVKDNKIILVDPKDNSVVDVID